MSLTLSKEQLDAQIDLIKATTGLNPLSPTVISEYFLHVVQFLDERAKLAEDFVSETNSSTFIQESILNANQQRVLAEQAANSSLQLNQQFAAYFEELKVQTEIAASGRTLDFIPIGTWNAATNTPALTTNASAVPAGKGYEVSVPGTQSITGTPTTFAETDKLISNGTTWYRRKVSTEAIARTNAQDDELDMLFTSSIGVVKRNLHPPLSFIQIDSTGAALAGSNVGQVGYYNRTQAITGNTNNLNETYVTYFDTGLTNLLQYEKVSFEAVINSFGTANPAIGIGFDSSLGTKMGYMLRKDGSQFNLNAGTVNSLDPALTDRAYVAGDIVKVDIINRNGVLKYQTSKNGVAAAEMVIASTQIPTVLGKILVVFRGSVSFTYSVTTSRKSDVQANIDASLGLSKTYTDGKVAGINGALNETTSSFLGVDTPAAGYGITIGGYRVPNRQVPYSEGLMKLQSLKIWCLAAGTGSLYILSRNSDATYNTLYTWNVNFVEGENTFTTALFGDLTLQTGWYFGFRTAAPAQLSGILGVAGDSYLLNSLSLSASSEQVSSWIIQFKATISVTETAIQKANALKKQIDAKSKGSIFYVSTTGSDNNDGSYATRFLTISRAIRACMGFHQSTIVVAAGDYYETLKLDVVKAENISLVAENEAVVRVMGSTKLNGWVKTAGYTNIYEAAFAGVIPVWTHAARPFIFEDKNPSKPILANQVHALQKGLTHRLPYTEIKQQVAGADLAATLTTMDTNPSTHYLFGGKLYIHASASGSPLTNGFDYHIATRAANTIPANTALDVQGTLVMDNIRFMFPTDGFRSSGFGKVERYHCVMLGCVHGGGGWRDDSSFVVSYKDEVGGCSNDGCNQHFDFYYPDFATLDSRRGVGVAMYWDLWTHDNGDDGTSGHQRSEVSIYGALSEYNGDGGYVPANGAAYRLYDCLSRNNVLAADATQAGFATANSAAGSGRNNTTLLAYNCISDSDKIGFMNNSAGVNNLELYNCVAREATLYNYAAYGAGFVKASNCKSNHSNAAKHKFVDAGATLTIINDNPLI